MAALAMAKQEQTARRHLLDGYSFEISARDAGRLDAVRAAIPDGTIVSITNLPNESDGARIEAAARVRALGLVPMPHVAARRIASEADLAQALDGFAAAGVDRLFVIAGDVPAPAGPFADALAMIAATSFARHGIGVVGISGYPDGHPGIDREALDHARRAKIAALAEQAVTAELVTQFGFEAEPVVAWLRRIRAGGFDGVVRMGLPGPANVGTLLRYAARCGVGVSARAMTRYGASITRLLSSAGPDLLYAALARAVATEPLGPVAIHLFPFGGLGKMADWAEAQR